MKKIEPDVIAKIYLYDATAKVSKKKGIPVCQYSCPIFFEDEDNGFDCRILLDQIGKSINPEEKLEDVPIKFLFYNLVKSKLIVGKNFKLWDMGIMGEGEIIKVIEHIK